MRLPRFPASPTLVYYEADRIREQSSGTKGKTMRTWRLFSSHYINVI
jgi:hypothetical protein